MALPRLRPVRVPVVDEDCSGLSDTVLTELERVSAGLAAVTARIAERVEVLASRGR